MSKSIAFVIAATGVLMSAPAWAEFSGGPVHDARHDASETASATATGQSATKKKDEKSNRTCITNNVTRQSRPTMPAASQAADAGALKPDLTGASSVSGAGGLSAGFGAGGSVIGGQTSVIGLLGQAVAAFSGAQANYSRQLGQEQFGLNAFDQATAAKLDQARAGGQLVTGSAVFAQGAGQKLATQVVSQSGAGATMAFDPAAAAALIGPATGR